jgi:hypothetical protein
MLFALLRCCVAAIEAVREQKREQNGKPVKEMAKKLN